MKIERGYAEYSDKAIKREAGQTRKAKLLLRQKKKTSMFNCPKQLKPIQKSANQTAQSQ